MIPLVPMSILYFAYGKKQTKKCWHQYLVISAASPSLFPGYASRTSDQCFYKESTAESFAMNKDKSIG